MKKFCKEHNITENQFKGIDKIEGSLDLHSLTSIPEGFNPTVGGDLDLRSLTSIPEGFNPTVGNDLILYKITSIPDTFNPTVGNCLDLHSLTTISNKFKPTVGCWLNLRSLTSIPEGFNPSVGGFLDLRSLTSIPDTFNPILGGGLWLNSLKSIPENFNPTIWGDVVLPEGLTCNKRELSRNHLFSWQDGKYIKVDGILTEVVNKKGYVYYVKKLNNDKPFCLITPNNERWSHDDTLKEANGDLIYKITKKNKR
jgi:hypothetical protein